MKREFRVAGITARRDSSGFLLVGAVYRGNRVLDGVVCNSGDSSLVELISEILSETKHAGQIRLLLLDEDLLESTDAEKLWEETGKPVLMITKNASFDPKHMLRLKDQIIWATGIDEESARRVLEVIMDETGYKVLQIAGMILGSIGNLHNV